MRIEVAGTNVATKILDEILDELSPELKEKYKDKLTPEVISSAYARISRSEKSIDELVDDSIEDTEKARRSVTSILGMGHQSIADHAIFNLNIKGVSRLLVEAIEERRLAGYTEKSQRYVTLAGDYIRPKEFTPEDLARFEELVKIQNAFYFRNNSKLLDYLRKQNVETQTPRPSSGHPSKRGEFTFLQRDLENKAKEDARYSLCLATETQLGCSYTGQTLELAVRKNKYGELAEQREFAEQLYERIVKIAPSLIQLSDPQLFKKYNKGKELKDDNFKFMEKNIREWVDEHPVPAGHPSGRGEFAGLIEHNNPDRHIIAALIHKNSYKSLKKCYEISDLLITEGRAKDLLKETLKYISEFDKVPREFETGMLIYEIIVSASCFAQLKRHRMNTLLVQDYSPEVGYAVPPGIKAIGADKELEQICKQSSNLYYEFKPKYGKSAEYCLTNAHRRRVIIATNIRELYHISRTREDKHSQWEIRDKARKMSILAKKVAPLTTILLGGKDEFNRIREKIYNS